MESATRVQRLVPIALLLLLAASCARHAARSPSVPPSRFELVSCRLAAGRELVEVKLRVAGPEAFEPKPESTYLVDERTGQKFYVIRLQRIGPLGGGREAAGGAVRSITFRNWEGSLRPGARLTLVIGGERLSHIVLEE